MHEFGGNLSQTTHVVYSFISFVKRSGEPPKRVAKTLPKKPAFKKAKQIRDYLFECEGQRLGLSDPKIWGGYLPSSGGGVRGRANTIKGNVTFDHVQIKLITEDKPLMGRGRLPKWLRDKKINHFT